MSINLNRAQGCLAVGDALILRIARKLANHTP